MNFSSISSFPSVMQYQGVVVFACVQGYISHRKMKVIDSLCFSTNKKFNCFTQLYYITIFKLNFYNSLLLSIPLERGSKGATFMSPNIFDEFWAFLRFFKNRDFWTPEVGPKMAFLAQKSRFSRIPRIFTERGVYH